MVNSNCSYIFRVILALLVMGSESSPLFLSKKHGKHGGLFGGSFNVYGGGYNHGYGGGGIYSPYGGAGAYPGIGGPAFNGFNGGGGIGGLYGGYQGGYNPFNYG
ncbi:unnamed protein product [Notodromas monacha]|uniref:Uncharacterized protein n=1 Tax=Notodromas monacha TaxID=399045 RepID=A0A7R9C3H2_9CRUS|nr:unnamed protein product [Notodromas monacha]CAG0925492.1 unnamed protein product [Notodromas monacha]